MSLWTPYADCALDLTKPATVPAVKQESVSPPAQSPQYTYPQYPVSPLRALPPEHAGYYPFYPHVQAVPSPQYSPDSASSSWSSPSLYPSVAPAALSPPDTPEYEVDALEEDLEYQAFERDAFQAMAEKNGGSLLGTNPRMRRAVASSQVADDGYRQQRERNNQAAKQSRDRRKLREVRLAFQVTFLKKKLAEMRTRLATRVCANCRRPCLC